ncbi:unnamed protein product [Caenorhabditis auriculariae]|uniref:Uncharacterized protein n=1 Tax=Caenorhabditis auriculariae TaxID=2777116 RepID=A0A8S1HQC9_9PELO|nr:unnamed protein product [Caenorhabditis auriculariae]
MTQCPSLFTSFPSWPLSSRIGEKSDEKHGKMRSLCVGNRVFGRFDQPHSNVVCVEAEEMTSRRERQTDTAVFSAGTETFSPCGRIFWRVSSWLSLGFPPNRGV